MPRGAQPATYAEAKAECDAAVDAMRAAKAAPLPTQAAAILRAAQAIRERARWCHLYDPPRRRNDLGEYEPHLALIQGGRDA